MREVRFPGEDLRAKRESLGYSLQEAYDRVHVPIQYLEAMERGDVTALPSAAYTIGFIQSYCEFLELRPEPYLDRYRYVTNIKKMTPAPAPREAEAPAFSMPKLRMPTLPTPQQTPPWMSEVITWGTISAVLLLGWLTWSTLISPIAQEDDTRVEAGTFEVEYPEYHFIDDDF